MSLIKRYRNNPLLGPEPDCPWGSGQARNPGVVYDGETFHMVFTAAPYQATKPFKQQLWLGYASSKDGLNFTRSPKPFISPSEHEGDFDWGTVEDTRVTQIGDTFYIAYAGRSMTGYQYAIEKYVPRNIPNDRPTWTQTFRRVGLAATKDFRSVERLGPITSEFISDANLALFPEKINGKYAMIHRPTPFMPGDMGCHYSQGNIFIAFSDDLLNWFPDNDAFIGKAPENDYLLIRPEQEWESLKVGGAGTPVATDEGWLMMYHAKDHKRVYRCGLLLLDRDDPRKVIARTPKPIFEPETDLEINGRVKTVVFPCAHVPVGDEWYIYYGASDEYVCLATAKEKELLDHVLRYRL